MFFKSATVAAGLLAVAQVASAAPVSASAAAGTCKPKRNVELGPRPEYLVNDMDDSPLKQKLLTCLEKEAKTTRFSVGHRGGSVMQFPEETKEAYIAGTRMGAGIQECDSAFTKDKQLVCRHAQCDLHTTTNILLIPELAAKCTTPFEPAAAGKPAKAKCCTSDITLAEFKTLCGKMDSFNATATSPQDYQGGVAPWRTTLYNAQCPEVLSHRDFITLVDSQGLDFTTELKAPEVPMPFDNGTYTYDMYRQQLIDDYKAAGIAPSRVWPQSFVYADILYWLEKEPEFAKQAVLLDNMGETAELLVGATANLTKYKEDGVKWLAPPLPYLISTDANDKYVPSAYGLRAKELGFDIITWSLERSGPLKQAAAKKDYYYQYMLSGTKKDGNMYEMIDVMAQQIGIKGIFSDWSATVTLYANCFGL